MFRAFGSGGFIEGVNLKLLRTVLANTYDIVRTKAPRREIEINYESLERAANSEETLATLFGVTTLDNPPDMSWFYRYTLSQVAEELGYGSHYGVWNEVQPFIDQVEEETGVNIKESENVYHTDIAFNKENSMHRYSDVAIELIRKVRDGEEYELDM